MNPWSSDAFGNVSIAVSKLKSVPLKEVVYFQPILSDGYCKVLVLLLPEQGSRLRSGDEVRSRDSGARGDKGSRVREQKLSPRFVSGEILFIQGRAKALYILIPNRERSYLRMVFTATHVVCSSDHFTLGIAFGILVGKPSVWYFVRHFVRQPLC